MTARLPSTRYLKKKNQHLDNFQVDDNIVKKKLPGRFFELNIHFGIFLGGQGDFSELFLGHMENFRGCMADVSPFFQFSFEYCLSNLLSLFEKYFHFIVVLPSGRVSDCHRQTNADVVSKGRERNNNKHMRLGSDVPRRAMHKELLRS